MNAAPVKPRIGFGSVPDRQGDAASFALAVHRMPRDMIQLVTVVARGAVDSFATGLRKLQRKNICATDGVVWGLRLTVYLEEPLHIGGVHVIGVIVFNATSQTSLGACWTLCQLENWVERNVDELRILFNRVTLTFVVTVRCGGP